MRARVGARVAAAAPAMMGELLCCTHRPIQSTRARLSRPTSGYPRAAATAAVAVVAAVVAALVARSEASWLAAAALRVRPCSRLLVRHTDFVKLSPGATSSQGAFGEGGGVSHVSQWQHAAQRHTVHL